jgi:hypothetical protein
MSSLIDCLYSYTEIQTNLHIYAYYSVYHHNHNVLDHTTSPPWVKFAYYNQPTNLATMSSEGTAKKWYYVELQPSGASNHLGRVMLVLANGVMRNDVSGTAVLDLASNSQFAAIALRPNGDVSMTNDADEMNTTTLTK